MLEDLAAAVGGRYTDAVLTDEDIDFLLSRGIFEDNQNLRDVDQDFDTWAEAGPWLLLLVLPLAALAFRRGWLLGLAMLFLINPQQQAMALSWQDLWLNKDQQGSRAFDSAEFDSAAQLFEDQDWRASSHYRSGDYEAALAELNQMEGPQAEYNRGNTLARLQRYEEALAAYDQVLDQQPDHTDAQANRQIVQNLLEQQQQQEQENQEQQQDDQGQDQQQSDDQQQGESEQQEQQSAQENQQEQQQEESDEAPQEQQQSEVTDSDAGQEDENQDEQPEPEQTLADQGESEEEQAMQQWLGRIEDNPGELLRNKFRYQTQQLLYEQLQNPRIFENPNQEQIW